MRLKGTKTRNQIGLVKVEICPICGDEYIVRRGRNRDDRIPTIFDPKQCGKHITMGVRMV